MVPTPIFLRPKIKEVKKATVFIKYTAIPKFKLNFLPIPAKKTLTASLPRSAQKLIAVPIASKKTPITDKNTLVQLKLLQKFFRFLFIKIEPH